jgi:hypothetical protein
LVESGSRPKFTGDSESERGKFEIPTVYPNMAKLMIQAGGAGWVTSSDSFH